MRNIGVMLGGQAAQEKGMGYDSYHECEESRRIFEIGSEVAELDLTEYCWGSKSDSLEGPIVQPALGAAYLADLAWMKKKGLRESMVMGHSVSEVIALGFADGLPPKDMFRILTVRGHAMEAAERENPGVMKAFIGPKPEEIEWILNFVNRRMERIHQSAAWLAMVNWREQHIISGDEETINFMERVSARVHDLGRISRNRVRFVRKGAAHSKHMEPAVQRVHDEIMRAKKYTPRIPALMNDGHFLQNPDDYADYLAGQLTTTASWRLSMWVAATGGYRYFIEPGKKDLMTGFMKKEFPDYKMLEAAFGRLIKIEKVPEIPERINQQLESLAA